MYLGRSSRCRKCHRAATAHWRRRNRDRENAERRAAYREAHPLPERPCVVCGRLFTKRPMRSHVARVAGTAVSAAEEDAKDCHDGHESLIRDVFNGWMI
jgi:hypothetical protein